MAGESSQGRTETATRREQAIHFLRERRGPLAVYLKGFAMGAAGTVPGVSGGTIALITGIYDRFIKALAQLDMEVVTLLGGLYKKENRTQFRERAEEMELVFLGALFAGFLSAVFTLARLITIALDTVPGPTFAFFGGLIGASALVLFDRRWLARPRHGIAAVVGFVVAFIIAGASGTGLLPETRLVVFFAAAIAISGMVLPGVSGSFLLLLLGQFEYITGTVSSFSGGIASLATGGSPGGLVADGSVLAVYAVGAVFGFLTTSRVVGRALDRYPGMTFAFLVCLMIGALRYPILKAGEHTEIAPRPLAGVALAAVLGGALVLLVDQYTDDLEYGKYE
jgi:putative membrane protein